MRTIEGKWWQLRWNWRGVASFFGQTREWSVQLHWAQRPFGLLIRRDRKIFFSFPG